MRPPTCRSLPRHAAWILSLVTLAAPRARAQFAQTEVSGPAAAQQLRLGPGAWAWESIPSVTYSVYRSDQPRTGFTCVLDQWATNTWPGDATALPASHLFCYVVTGFDGTDDNSSGTWSNGTPRVLTTPCPRAWACCMADGSCQETSPRSCLTAGGTPQGVSTACATTSCPQPCPSGTPVPGQVAFTLTPIGTFTAPVFLGSPPGDTDRVFILERAGRIQILHRDGTRATFLDISSEVLTGGERGLLGLAFHPDYANNHRFYVYYSTPQSASCGGDHCAHVSEFTSSAATPDVADPATERLVLQQPEPFSNHNGSWLAFGPDRDLYIAFGDGGSAGDPMQNGQNLGTWLAKILRIDVDGRDAGLQYAIPPTNPFVGQAGALGEIWCYGVRNPFRDSFDRATGDLYLGDVGQNAWEEVDVAPASAGGGKGLDYGWRIMEATHCYSPATGCNQAGLTLPDWEYPHVSTCGAAVIGGYVYRGCRMPDWQGWYFFTDYCDAWLDAFNYSQGVGASYRRVMPGATFTSPVSFGEDGAGELYVVQQGGTVLRIDPQ